MSSDEKETKNDVPADGETKPSGQEVGPPKERVDDETNADESKTTHRQD